MKIKRYLGRDVLNEKDTKVEKYTCNDSPFRVFSGKKVNFKY